MKVREMLDLLSHYDPELDIMINDPNRSSIIRELGVVRIAEVYSPSDFSWDERHSCKFPVGYKFVKFWNIFFRVFQILR